MTQRFDSEPKIVEYKDVKKLFLNKATELGVTIKIKQKEPHAKGFNHVSRN